MRKCSEDCIECCDFCKFVVHAIAEDGSRCEPLGCYKHQDYEHQQEVDSCGCCNDFECFRCKPTNADRIRSLSNEELARRLIYLADFNEGDYDWDENPIDNWFTYYVCSDGSQFENEEDAIEHEVVWLKQPWEDKND